MVVCNEMRDGMSSALRSQRDPTSGQAKAVYLLPPSGGEETVLRFYGLTLSGFGFLVILAAVLGQRSVASTDKPTAIDTGNLELGQTKGTFCGSGQRLQKQGRERGAAFRTPQLLLLLHSLVQHEMLQSRLFEY
jgi:hypothetical protein